MNPLVEKVLSRLGPKARAQAEADLAKQGHPDFIHLRPLVPENYSPDPNSEVTIILPKLRPLPYPEESIDLRPSDHDPYDVRPQTLEDIVYGPNREERVEIQNAILDEMVVSAATGKLWPVQDEPAKRKETTPAKLPSLPAIKCHNELDSLVLVVKHKVPSWNAILALGHWQRAKLKKAIQDDFLSALRASAADSSTRITSVRSTLSIAADTLDSYQRTMQERRTSRLAKKRSERRKKSAPKS